MNQELFLQKKQNRSLPLTNDAAYRSLVLLHKRRQNYANALSESPLVIISGAEQIRSAIPASLLCPASLQVVIATETKSIVWLVCVINHVYPWKKSGKTFGWSSKLSSPHLFTSSTCKDAVRCEGRAGPLPNKSLLLVELRSLDIMGYLEIDRKSQRCLSSLSC